MIAIHSENIFSHLGHVGVDPLSFRLHYLDNFLTMGPPGLPECRNNLTLLLEKCKTLGLPTAIHKVEGPATTLIFLGIEFDTVHMTM